MTNSLKILWIVILLQGYATCIHSQNIPIYNHYYSNPFFYNPSYAGSKKQTEINLLYRQQYVGLSGAPVSSCLTLTAPIKNFGFGLNFYNTKKGILSTSSAKMAFSYKVNFNSKSNLQYGLSAGLGRNSLNMNELDQTDAAIANSLDKSYYWEGQAGINLQHKNMNIGFSLPQLLGHSITDTDLFQELELNPFNSAIVSFQYKLNLGEHINLLPIAVYKIKETGNQFESYLVGYLKDYFWVGGVYRQSYGTAAITGFQISKLLKVSYSYEFSSIQISQLTYNTHEFSLSLLMGGQSAKTKVSKTSKPIPKGLKRKTRKS